MGKTVLFRTRLPARRKKNAERILAKIGLTPGQLVNMVFAQVELKNGLPFAASAYATDGYLAHEPNAETIAAIREATEGLPRYATMEEALASLGSHEEDRPHK